MRIFSKATLRFHHPEDRTVHVTVQSENFATVPDWVRDSAMWKLAKKDGTVFETETKEDVKAAESAAEKGNVKSPSARARAAEGTDTAEPAGN